jgi:type I restriction enzyme S subunit
MNCGLTDIELKKLHGMFSQYTDIEKVVLYGSRTKGNYKPFSDVDITLIGNTLTHRQLNKLSLDIDELLLPYRFDISIFHTLSNPDLIDHIQRVGITIYQKEREWKECKFDNVAELIKDVCSPTSCKNVRYIGLEHIEQEALRLNSIGESNDVTSNKFLFKSNDILFGKLRPYFRKVVKPKFNGICSTDIWVLRAKKGFEQVFLYYFVANWDFVNLADGGEAGTRMPRADWNFVKSTIWNFPPLSEQRAIASVLSSLDDKIDLLHRQNATLEKMAETLFRQWFVEEAKEEWEEVRLGDILDIGIGRTPPRKEFRWFSTSPNDMKWISIKDLGNDGVYIYRTNEYLTKNAVETFNIPIIPKDTVVLSFKMTVGRVSITSEDMLSNEAIAHFKINNRIPITTEFLYLYLKSYQYDSLGTTSSIVTAINSTMIKDMTIFMPSNIVIQKFQMVIRCYFEKIKANQEQIYTLTTLRDTLLPKLMSGEVKIIDMK